MTCFQSVFSECSTGKFYHQQFSREVIDQLEARALRIKKFARHVNLAETRFQKADNVQFKVSGSLLMRHHIYEPQVAKHIPQAPIKSKQKTRHQQTKQISKLSCKTFSVEKSKIYLKQVKISQRNEEWSTFEMYKLNTSVKNTRE